ncbi:hypothetical protein BJ970_004886 [Saccharopolyspora phatthalungensis]|uniref:GGDEF domain-containing protein n=1 Tax=Saccharopolyspora phatthalungensis TaxID=664693 RepID=A0A840Q4C7_9PSEU|nr:hypothetical protein [Saccharopolyspora phatthalungensis]
MLLGHLLAVTFAARAVLTEHYDPADLHCFVVLICCACAHAALTREPEERRRGASRDRGVAHIDLTSVWLFTAAILLPPLLALAVCAAVRTQRWLIARKPPHRYLFSTSGIVLSMLAAHALAQYTGLHPVLTGHTPWPTTPAGITTVSLGLTACVAAYFLTQAALVAGAIALSERTWRPARLFGDRDDNALELTALLAAACTAVLQAHSALLLIPVLPLAIAATRCKHHLEKAKRDHEDVRRNALHDPLTGLPVRAAFEPLAQLALATDHDHHQHTSLLLIDLDNLKQWNDTIGHLGADEILKTSRTCCEPKPGKVICCADGAATSSLPSFPERLAKPHLSSPNASAPRSNNGQSKSPHPQAASRS